MSDTTRHSLFMDQLDAAARLAAEVNPSAAIVLEAVIAAVLSQDKTELDTLANFSIGLIDAALRRRGVSTLERP